MVIFEKAVSTASAPGVTPAQIQRFVRQAQALAKVPGEVDVLIAANPRLRELNRRFRRKNKPTDVLSFPRPSGGDIAISAQIAHDNARLYGHSIADELKILVLHGMLHLAGYDHETDNGRMARVEARLRARLKLPASLIDRAHSRGKSKRPVMAAAIAIKKTSARRPKAAAARRRTQAARRGSPQ
ncbi:MAG TPA: rRNA maturation RNase YbeY [Candidatus Angelobacter sp.]|nr:rRNA maturation RNase YbeY [Candidatus Angelobacter sp.]